jgi:prepilin-type processing-associated H-X9-DG protein
MRKAIDAYSSRLKEAVRKSHWTIEKDRMHVEVQATNSTATIGILTGLLLPAVQSAREAARRMSSSNNLKQMGLAMHNYADVYRKLPARAIYAKDGTPLLSWRVAILPFIEQQQLYEQFHLDEPWDSEHNKTLISKMPPMYASPRSPGESFHSNYVMPYGEGLPGSLQKIGFQNITDGTSNTIALVEVDGEYAVPWTAPEDFDADEESLTDAFPMNGQGTNVAFYDGSVRFLSQFIDEEVLHALLTHAGGEVTPPGGF